MNIPPYGTRKCKWRRYTECLDSFALLHCRCSRGHPRWTLLKWHLWLIRRHRVRVIVTWYIYSSVREVIFCFVCLYMFYFVRNSISLFWLKYIIQCQIQIHLCLFAFNKWQRFKKDHAILSLMLCMCVCIKKKYNPWCFIYYKNHILRSNSLIIKWYFEIMCYQTRIYDSKYLQWRNSLK